jgi:hypothetical protein
VGRCPSGARGDVRIGNPASGWSRDWFCRGGQEEGFGSAVVDDSLAIGVEKRLCRLARPSFQSAMAFK